MTNSGGNIVAGSGGGDNNLSLPGGGKHLFIIHKPVIKITALFLGVVVSCLVMYKSAYPFQFLPSSFGFSSGSSLFVPETTSRVRFDPKLGRVLKNAATTDKTVILTTLNEAWAEPHSILDIFLESFKTGNNTEKYLNHLVIVTLDQKAHNRCLAIHPHCYALNTTGQDFEHEAYFMTPDYLEMMWKRIDFLASVLEMGYNFVFTVHTSTSIDDSTYSCSCTHFCFPSGIQSFALTMLSLYFLYPFRQDADIVWLQDPFPRFYKDADFQIACDFYNGNPKDRRNHPNGGFTYAKSNNRTIRFYKFWYASRKNHPGLHDQDVLNKIKQDSFLYAIGLRMRFLDTAYFGGFCERSRDFNKVCTMHANCCFGMDNKVHDLKLVLEDWEKFKSLSPSDKALASPSWRAPQNCSTSNYHPPDLHKKSDLQGGNP
ncbi:hypothetical protein Tsubulata_023723 [Turnera subulata]|uniref:Nucleotide-diphospho-sugar transferase domain-containing protein n=1 Tax=Turnera subulata TaxID=218843 RepID=A0A9Q0FQG3_9ROSI|nr:hypothetical protein Tsubulata_023723 [Turnera subulata]